jgi:hypothetical protein
MIIYCSIVLLLAVAGIITAVTATGGNKTLQASK